MLQALDDSPTDKFVVLFRKDLNLKFRALYSGTVIRISATIRIICTFSRKDLKLKLYTLCSGAHCSAPTARTARGVGCMQIFVWFAMRRWRAAPPWGSAHSEPSRPTQPGTTQTQPSEQCCFYGFLVCATFLVSGVTFPLCRYEWFSLVQAHMVEQYFKYDSGAKEFRGLSARDFGATTDAVALHPIQHAKRTAKT